MFWVCSWWRENKNLPHEKKDKEKPEKVEGQKIEKGRRTLEDGARQDIGFEGKEMDINENASKIEVISNYINHIRL